MGALLAAALLACGVAPAPQAEPAPGVEAAIGAEAVPLRYLERVTGGADAEAALPLILAVHGRGDRPEHFAGLVEGWQIPARVVLPQAPIATPGGGWSWFAARLSDPPGRLAAELAEVADALAALTRRLAAERPTVGRPVITGFSQGGMLSYTLAVRHPDLFAGAVPIGGFLPPELLPEGAAPVAPVRALHGGADPRIDPGLARSSVAALRAAGADASLIEYPGVPHAISREMRAEQERAVQSFLP